ncbi:2'-5' RNA ligase family protein [Fictibacillus sp. KIGAM418]|uniref:Putative phosphoesterase LCY76_09335 n=1 Tax=Fictibacillus marinisediminis TaxID=2878389 RepID=A0A9X2BF27_9BACL|nr:MULTISPECIES: 2'-5' RNA ligase family protein [Fictibacillus]MCK6256797.1 2'-5' RNA ligase family protein [Fictibacillus marinisediminis]MED2973510.1 2'-5' RNA ligase family protein [Fictibacillus sp. B-59209]UZJ77342.1 2'-5' RNA ligase family protein [Fictibacillus sp. KU28468]SFE08881.1 2'-5' RNA ligase [Bacillus sp. OV194]
MKYGIAIFPSEELKDKINSYRKRYDPHYSIIAPHITLKDPFEANDAEIEEIVEYIETVAKNIPPINIHITRASSFHPVNNVIYLKVDNNDELNSLHELLYEGPLEHEHPYNFVPHLTLAQKLSDVEHADVLERLKMVEAEYQETVTEFHLLKMDEESDRWKVYKTFALGKDV